MMDPTDPRLTRGGETAWSDRVDRHNPAAPELAVTRRIDVITPIELARLFMAELHVDQPFDEIDPATRTLYTTAAERVLAVLRNRA